MTATQRRTREALRKVGTRRQTNNQQTATLRRDTKRVLERAKRDDIPIGEAATLAGVSRSTAYEVYLQGDSHARDSRARKNTRSADGRAPKGQRHPKQTRKVQGANARKPQRRRKAQALELLTEVPDWAGTMKAPDLLMAVPKIGRVKCNRILNTCRIAPSKTIGGMTERQRRELSNEIRKF